MTTNLFTPNQSDGAEWGIAGFYVGNAQGSGPGPAIGGGVTVTQDSTQVWHGTYALKAVTDGSGGFQAMEVRIPAPGPFIAGATYTFSAYVYSAAGGPSVRFYCQANTGSIGTVPTVTLLAGWNRYTVTVTLPNPITQAWIGLRLDTGSTPQAITYWIDGIQCEQAATVSAWTSGTGSVVSPASASLLATAALSLASVRIIATSIALLAEAALNAVATLIVPPVVPPNGVTVVSGGTAPVGIGVAFGSSPVGISVTK